MIKIEKITADEWVVFNSVSFKCATITKINEYNAFYRNKKQYRVDADGKTLDSLIPNMIGARKIAYAYVKKILKDELSI